MARYEDNDNPSDLIKQWMSNKDSFDYYGLWEELNNSNFNSVEFHLIKNNISGRNRFLMNPTKWKEHNPSLAKDGNIRDYTDLLHLVILNNLENSNAEFIKLGISQKDRLIKLNESARKQTEILKSNSRFNNLLK